MLSMLFHQNYQHHQHHHHHTVYIIPWNQEYALGNYLESYYLGWKQIINTLDH